MKLVTAIIKPFKVEQVRRYYQRERPIEMRAVEYGRYLGQQVEGDRFHVWVRATGHLPDEPAIHQCVLAYASDMSLLGAAHIPHGGTGRVPRRLTSARGRPAPAPDGW